MTVLNNGPRTWTSSSHQVVCGWADSGIQVAVNQAPASAEYGDAFHATWTTTVPSAPGVTALSCQLITGGAALASTSAGTIIGSANQFNAEITAFNVPATMPYGIDGDDALPRTVFITVRNAGTETWTTQWLPQLALRSGPEPSSTPLPGPVAPGAEVTVGVSFSCLRAGANTFTAQMIFSGIPISSISRATTRCLGTDTMPGGD